MNDLVRHFVSLIISEVILASLLGLLFLPKPVVHRGMLKL